MLPKFTHLLVALTLSTPLVSSYVIDVFRDDNCGGNVQSVNVWDNTCASKLVM